MVPVELTKIISPGFTDDMLQNILQKKSGLTNISVVKINLASSTAKGDSYLSSIIRFTVKAHGNNGSEDNQDFQVNVIVKKVPDIQARAKTFRSVDFFKCEGDFFNKVWPALDTFQKSKNLERLFKSIPTCLSTYTDGITDFIALEDLSYEGYNTMDRSSAGVDLQTALFTLKHFAQFHALSIAYRDQHPQEFEEITDGLEETYFNEKYRKWYNGALDRFLNVVKDAVEKELPASYLVKLNELTKQDIFGNICKLLKKKSKFCAITHGDCWAPNFLIKGTKADQKLVIIDFQLMRYSSLSTDVLFFIYTCVDPIVRNEDWDLLLEEYYKEFVDALNKFGSKSDISLKELKEDMKSYGLFAFGMCNEAIIMSLMEDEDVADLEAIHGSEGIPLHEVWQIEPIKDTYKRQKVANYIKHLMDNNFI